MSLVEHSTGGIHSKEAVRSFNEDFAKREKRLETLIRVFKKNIFHDLDPFKRREKMKELIGYQVELRRLRRGYISASRRMLKHFGHEVR
jgi:hypothetical protein